jgi:hypothetical protein
MLMAARPLIFTCLITRRPELWVMLLATLLGADPKKTMDEDLMRMKTLIEEKRVIHDVAENPLAI